MEDVKNMKPYFGVLNEMKRQGITQEEMAKAIGVDRVTFNLKVNRKQNHDFTYSQAKEIAEKLKSKPSLLFK